jgi:CelD/BcsL family acetyltransferase involved in cellulose biosynthesis
VQRTRHVTALEREWDDLADRAGAPPWLRPGWVRPWHAAFGRAELELAFLRVDGRLAALMPLEVDRDEVRATVNYHSPAAGILAESPTYGLALATGVLEAAPRRVSVGFLPIGSPTRVMLRAASAATGRTSFERIIEHCPILEPDGDWDGYLAQRRGHMIRELRRRRRRLERDAPLELEIVGEEPVEPARVDEALDAAFAVEASGWKGVSQTSMSAQPEVRRFYVEVVRWLASRGWLRLGILRHANRPIAMDVAVEGDSIHSLLKTGYDERLRSASPGMILRQLMLERAFRLGLRRYNFLGHADAWKREWTELAEPHLLVQSFAGSPAGQLDRAAQRFGRPIARRLLKRAVPA